MHAVLLLIALIGHSALWVGLVNRIHAVHLQRWLIDAVTFVSAGLCAGIPLVVVGRYLTGGGLPVPFATGGSAGPLDWYASVSVVVAALAGGQALYHRLHPERRGALLRETSRVVDLGDKHGEEIVAAGVPRTLSRLPGNQLLKLHVAEKEVLVPGLPAELDGLRIAHLTDLHMSGRIRPGYFREVTDAALQAKPDLIALTGDLVEHNPQIGWIDEALAPLAAPHGVYFVLGNHDRKMDHARLRQALTSTGMGDLGGGALDLEVRGRRVRLVGNELPWFGPAGDPRSGGSVDLVICLAHSPDQFAWAARQEVDLILAGHNHGGQIRFPLLGALVAPSLHGTRYACGVFRRGKTVLHVSRGAGSLAPLRYLCPPELAILTLRPGAADRHQSNPASESL